MARQRKLPRGVEKITRASGRTVYRGRWRDRESGERFSTECYNDPQQARAALVAARNASDAYHDAAGNKEGQRYREGVAVPQTLEELGEAYLDQLQVEASTVRSYRQIVSGICAYFGADRRPGDVDRAMVTRWVKDMAKDGRVEGTRAGRISVLRGMFKLAVVEHHSVAKNPCDGVTPGVDEDDGRRVGRYPTEQEIMDAHAEMPWWTAPVVFLAADSGLRRSELAGLCWSHLDLDLGTVVVERMVDCEGNWRLGTKGRRRGAAKGRGVVPLSERTIKALRALREARPARDADRVFRAPNGCPVAPATIYGHWRRARTVAMRPAVRHVRLHDLRWHTATTAVEGHLPLHQVMSVMRHHSPRMTHRYVAAPDISAVSEQHRRAFGHLSATDPDAEAAAR